MQQRIAKETIAGARKASAELATTKLEFRNTATSSDELVATLRSELAAARHAQRDGAKDEVTAVVEQNTTLDMKLRNTMTPLAVATQHTPHSYKSLSTYAWRGSANRVRPALRMPRLRQLASRTSPRRYHSWANRCGKRPYPGAPDT